jgi:hypothetical protein
MMEASNDQLTSAANRADFTDFICILLFGISVNIIPDFRKREEGEFIYRGNFVRYRGSYR